MRLSVVRDLWSISSKPVIVRVRTFLQAQGWRPLSVQGATGIPSSLGVVRASQNGVQFFLSLLAV